MHEPPVNQTGEGVFLCIFLGSEIVFQAPGQGTGSLLCRNSGFAWGLESGEWRCASVWGTQKWVGKGHRNAKTRADDGPSAQTDPAPHYSFTCTSSAQSQVAPGLLFTNPTAAVWVLPIPQGNISALSPGETQSICL